MKIAHTADNHLGYRQYGYIERERDFYRALDHVVTRAIALEVDVLLLAGDLFDMPKPPGETVWKACQSIQRARDVGIKVVGIDGNHDNCDNAWLQLCGVTPLESTGGMTQDGVRMVGIDACRPAVFHQKIDALVAAGETIDVVVIHQSLGEFADFEAQAITAMDLAPKLAKIGVRMVCMGDIHKYAETVVGGVRFIYCGSSELNASDEAHDKTFTIVDITKDTLTTGSEPIPTRPIIEYQLQDEATLDQITADAVRDADAQICPLIFVWYPPEAKALAKRAEEVLKDHGSMYRFQSLSSGGDFDLRQKIAKQGFERKGALEQLKGAVSAYFDEGSPEMELVYQLLDSPDNVESVVTKYMESQGVHV